MVANSMTEINRCVLMSSNGTLLPGHCAVKPVLLVIIIMLSLLLFMMIISLITPTSVRLTLSWLICHARDKQHRLETGMLRKRNGSLYQREQMLHSDILNSQIGNINHGNHSSRGCRHKCEHSSSSEGYTPPLLSPLIRKGSSAQNPHYLRQQKEKKEQEKSAFLFDQKNDVVSTENNSHFLNHDVTYPCKTFEHMDCDSLCEMKEQDITTSDDANLIVFNAQDHVAWFKDEMFCITSYKSDSAILSTGLGHLFEASETRGAAYPPYLPIEVGHNAAQAQLLSTFDGLTHYDACSQKMDDVHNTPQLTPLVKIFPPSPCVPSSIDTDLIDHVRGY